MKNNKEAGFTLIELLTVIAISAILFTLSAVAIRHFWHVRSLEGAADGAATQLRALQSSVTSESNPIVFGAYFEPGASEWYIVRFDPEPESGIPECRVVGTRSLSGGTQIESAIFSDDANVAPTCETAVGASPGNGDFVFFYARGNATGGDVVFAHQALGGRSRTVRVSPIVGRVTKL